MKISIITINYNNRNGLEHTIKSVQMQTVKDFEYIIIDGGSTDGSKDLLSKYTEIIDIQISEKDEGPFYAMNKGLEKASGEYCIFMNSGDLFYDKYVIENFIQSQPKEDILTGICEEHLSNNIKQWLPASEHEFCLRWFYRHSLSHQSTFIKTSLMKEIKYDTEFRIVSDWLFFMLTLLNKNATYKKLPFYVAHYMDGGISRNEKDAFNEREKAIIKYYGNRILRDFHSMHYGLNEWDSLSKKVDPNSKIGRIIMFFTKLLLNLRK